MNDAILVDYPALLKSTDPGCTPAHVLSMSPAQLLWEQPDELNPDLHECAEQATPLWWNNQPVRSAIHALVDAAEAADHRWKDMDAVGYVGVHWDRRRRLAMTCRGACMDVAVEAARILGCKIIDLADAKEPS